MTTDEIAACWHSLTRPELADELGRLSQKAKPSLADLSGDSVCRAILAAWAKAPWGAACPAMLADRTEEIGLGSEALMVRQLFNDRWRATAGADVSAGRRTRTERRRWFTNWRASLCYHFGDFPANT